MSEREKAVNEALAVSVENTALLTSLEEEQQRVKAVTATLEEERRQRVQAEQRLSDEVKMSQSKFSDGFDMGFQKGKKSVEGSAASAQD